MLQVSTYLDGFKIASAQEREEEASRLCVEGNYLDAEQKYKMNGEKFQAAMCRYKLLKQTDDRKAAAEFLIEVHLWLVIHLWLFNTA